MLVKTFTSFLKLCKPHLRVSYDFCNLVPTSVRSWRGAYEHLAIGWSEDAEAPSVEELIKRINAAMALPWEGYKGGIYTANSDTQIYVDNWGRYTETRIVGVESDEYTVMILTGREE